MSDDLTAPLPLVGLRGNYALGPKWMLRGSGELFAIEIDDVKGSLLDFHVGVDYHINERFALGLAYNSVALDVDSGGSDFRGPLEWDYDGVLLYLKLDFGSVE